MLAEASPPDWVSAETQVEELRAPGQPLRAGALAPAGTWGCSAARAARGGHRQTPPGESYSEAKGARGTEV